MHVKRDVSTPIDITQKDRNHSVLCVAVELKPYVLP